MYLQAQLFSLSYTKKMVILLACPLYVEQWDGIYFVQVERVINMLTDLEKYEFRLTQVLIQVSWIALTY
jgi:hypothetical protein